MDHHPSLTPAPDAPGASPSPFDEFRAKETDAKVREILEELTRNYGASALCLYVRNATGESKRWTFDGENPLTVTVVNAIPAA